MLIKLLYKRSVFFTEQRIKKLNMMSHVEQRPPPLTQCSTAPRSQCRPSPSCRGGGQAPLLRQGLGPASLTHPPWGCSGCQGRGGGGWGPQGAPHCCWCWRPWLLHWSGCAAACPQSWGGRRAARTRWRSCGPGGRGGGRGAWGSRSGCLPDTTTINVSSSVH